MLSIKHLVLTVGSALLLSLTACETTDRSHAGKADAGDAKMASAGHGDDSWSQDGSGSNPYDKPGFKTMLEDNRLWVLKPGQEKHEKHITMVGAGPGGKTIKALNRQTALAYLAAKPGFEVSVEDGRLWVLKPGQEKHEKHISLIGAGPHRMTIKALDKETAVSYLAAKPGYKTFVEDGKLWVLRPGQEPAEKHITMINAGPTGMSVKALDRKTAIEYLASKPGFDVELDEDGRLWVFREGSSKQKPEKHVTRINAGPMRTTVKAEDRAILDAYLRG